MSDQSQEIAGLHVTVRLLTERIEQLEQVVSRLAPRARRRAGPRARRRRPSLLEPSRGPPAPRPRRRRRPRRRSLRQRRGQTFPPLQPPPPPRPPSPPFDWGKLAEQLFAARTLAWAGGVATALGIVLLFVMAASRGWITPSMRVGLGVLVSLGLLGAALELDRRTWRSDAILAAAGVAIAGLYASLWAATSLYHLSARRPPRRWPALVAAIAVAVAIRIKQEPLARLRHVGGHARAAAREPRRDHRRRALRSGHGGGLAPAPRPLRLAPPRDLGVGDRPRRDAGAPRALVGSPRLRRPGHRRRRHGGALRVPHLPPGAPAGRPLAPHRARLADRRQRLHDLARRRVPLRRRPRGLAATRSSGITLAGLAVVWALIAAVPFAVRRPHADLADGLAGFALASAAIATGLLAGGPALVCAWTAESAMLVLLAERIRRRSAPAACARSSRPRSTCCSRSWRRSTSSSRCRRRCRTSAPDPTAGRSRSSPWRSPASCSASAFARFKRPELAAAWLVPALALGLPAALGARRRVGRDRLRRHGRRAPDLPPHAAPGELDAGVGLPRDRIRPGGSPAWSSPSS